MERYGLIGEKLSHSFSKEIHESISDYKYDLIELSPEKVKDFFSIKEFKAVNVTIPYKETVIPFLDYVDEAALKIGAVNTVVNKNGKLFGYNTDYFGLKDMLLKNEIDVKGKKVVILGTGGTSKTTECVTKDLGAKEIIKISSRKKPDYKDLETLYTDCDFIINCTPVGMYPGNGKCLIDLKKFPALKGAIDVIYNPLKTKFLLDAESLNVKAVNGLYMLVCQAVYASFIFKGLDVNENLQTINNVTLKTYKKILFDKTNIVFTGMPSSGKSTFARILGQKLSRQVIDTDFLIEKKTGMKISDYIPANGEKAFRAVEKEVIAEVSKQSGVIISTGGGAVLDTENVSALKQNGKIIFLDRPLELLKPTSSRPLSSDYDALKKRYDERIDIYRSTADVTVRNDGEKEDVVERIMSLLCVQ